MKQLSFGIALFFLGTTAGAWALAYAQEKPPAPEPAAYVDPLTHRQEVWIDALEWCESKAIDSAINKVDRDGTPSYYNFQFKPDTFEYYGKMYEVLPKEMTAAAARTAMASSTLQMEVVRAMVADSKHIDWHTQFPDCTKRLGLPPTK